MTRRRRYRLIKWTAGIFVVLFVATLMAGYAVLANMNFDGLKATVEAEARVALGRDLKIAGPVDLAISWTPAIAIRDVTLGNAPWGTYPEMATVRRVKVEVELLPLLTGDVRIRRLVIIEPTILLETSKDGIGNWILLAPRSGVEGGEPPGPAIPAFNNVEVRNARVLFRDGRSGGEYDLRLERARARAAGPAQPIALDVQGALGGHAFSVEGTVGSLSRVLGSGPIPLDVRVETRWAEMTLKGALTLDEQRTGFDFNVRAHGSNLADAAEAMGVAIPQLGAYEIGARLSDTDDGIRLRGLTLKLGDSDLAGSATLSFAGARPRVEGAFSADSLDIAELLEAASGMPVEMPREPVQESAKTRFVIPDIPLPFEALNSIDGHIKLTVSTAVLPGSTRVEDLEMALKLDDGLMRAERLNATVSGGRLTGDAVIDTRVSEPDETPVVELNARIDGFDYGRYVSEAGIAEGVTGKTDVELRLRGQGASTRALASTLNGRVELIAGTGRVRNELLRVSGSGLIDMVAGWREADKDLLLNCVVMRLPVKNGVVVSEVVLLDTEAMTIGANGRIDLRDETLSVRVTSQAKRASLMSLAVPVQILGTLADPSVVPDPLGTAVGAAKIAGLFLNPLVAGAAILLDSATSDRNPCVAAIEGEKPASPSATGLASHGAGRESSPDQEGSGVAPAPGSAIEDAAKELTGATRDLGEGVGGAVKDLGEGVGDALKGLLER